jgi:DNA replication protein DnaC
VTGCASIVRGQALSDVRRQADIISDFDRTFNRKILKTKLVELASARFIESHGGVLLIGPPGVGKSHIATAIAVGAIRAGRRALMRSTFDLSADFAQAEATGARAREKQV